MRNCYILVLLVFSNSTLFAQSVSNYPKYYFRNPLGIPMELTANMGELRSNHWHMGLDLRTQQKENLPVYAAAAGYISKVRIEPFGYGRSIFINHPNGLTTVYGHLNDFFPALEKYVTEQQYKNQVWAIELDFSKTQFPVFKSQLIAYSGNTGSSQGPHLHFEIRDTKTSRCLNPLLFGFPVKDDVPPEIIRLGLYNRSISLYRQSPQIFSLKKRDGNNYVLNGVPVIQTGFKKISFAIQAFDRMKPRGSEDGIYSAKIFFNNEPVIGFVLDSIDYDESAYINAQIDYKYRYNGGYYLQHLSLLPGDHGAVYKKQNGNGILNLNDTGFHLVHIDVRDVYNHRAQLDFMVQYLDSLEHTALPDTSIKFIPNQNNFFQKQDFELSLTPNALYDTVPVVYYKSPSALINSISAIHRFNDASFPLHDAVTVRIKPEVEVPEELKNKIVIRRNDNRSSSVRKATWQQEWVSASFKEFGNFQALIDTIPPVVKSMGKEDTIVYSGSKYMAVEAWDNFGSLRNFRAEIDGQWVRFSNDKAGTFIYVFDEKCPYGIHQLKVTIDDLVGNSTTQTQWFRREPYTAPARKVVHKKKKVISGKSINKRPSIKK
ncbi:MAG: M23 family metallopeptidase [Bacteroidetes bacterium]|nr:M23 family metallopeptidase [Bacteroidota bacterium]MBS1631903.1 M23 family metallopeptidase [Bacteroidota bacterium]